MSTEASPSSTPTPSERFVESYETGDEDFNPDTPPTQSSSQGASATEPAAVASPPTPLPISASLLRRARENCGFDDAEIAELSPAELEHSVSRIEAQLLKQARQSQRDESVLNATRSAPGEQPIGDSNGPPVTNPVPPVAARPEPDDFAEFEAERDQYPPIMHKVVDKLRQLEKELAEIKALKQEFAQDKQRRANQSFSEQCDTFFSGRADVYGDGSYKQIKPGTPPMAKRQATIEAASRQKDGTWEEKLARAETMLWGARAPAGELPRVEVPAPRSLPRRAEDGRFERPDPLERALAEEFRQAAVARPTQRDDAELPPGEEKAKRTWERGMRERAAAAANGATDEANANDFP